MRVLWLGDAGSHTGFARVTHAIGERLVARGHDVEVLAPNYTGDHWPTTLKLFLPTKLDRNDYYGRSRITEMLGHEPDVVIMLGDPWTIIQLLFENGYDRERYLLQYKPLIGYIPIDGTNLPPTWGLLSECMKRVAMTKYGQAHMPEAALAYHGIDRQIFHPVSKSEPLKVSSGAVITSKKEAKKQFGFDPDGFLVLRVDTNSERKDYPSTWKALVPVMKRHSDIQVHFHCVKTGPMAVNLAAVLDRDQDTAKRFSFPDMIKPYLGWPQEDLVGLYNAADLFVSTSHGEGFGLTLAEAAACGVPIVAQNVAAIPEVVGPGGVLLDPVTTITTIYGQDQWLPDVDEFSDAIEHLYLSGGVRRKLGRSGRSHVAGFDWENATDVFETLMTEVTSAAAA